ncbi:hypothetical protein AYO40_00565 [Planctomycetaceae bacterium SCGC AG-212-D15]|nr:hypothetical protein AYO40_00565 [Planctomycetaceae bacterium SCGC AG-212-D15]
MEQFANNAQSTLASAIGNGALSLTVQSAAGFSTQGNFRIQIDNEIMLVTNVSGNVFTVSRGQEGTSAASHNAGACVTQELTAGAMAGLKSDLVPPGILLAFAGSSVPAGWLLCDGSAVSRTTYAGLFTAISTTWGAGDGSTTFNLPDLRGRIAVGADGSGVHLPVNKPALGASGGEEQHTLSTAELPAHNHATSGYGLARISNAGEGVNVAPNQSTSNHVDVSNPPQNPASVGSGSAHNNLQPYAAVQHIIKT